VSPLTAHPPGTVQGAMLDLLLATCVEPAFDRCRYCGAAGDQVNFVNDAVWKHTRCHQAECVGKHATLVRAVLTELKLGRCFCGYSKRPDTSVCTRCYRRLPLDMRNSLYAHISSGYLENYAAARRFLQGGAV
jgi:hypothetical protein